MSIYGPYYMVAADEFELFIKEHSVGGNSQQFNFAASWIALTPKNRDS
jgi:hypothetical protein